MKSPDKRELDKRKDEAEQRKREELEKVQQEISRLKDETEGAAVKNRIQGRDIIVAGDGESSGRSGVPKARPRVQRRPLGMFTQTWESLVKQDLDSIVSKPSPSVQDHATMKRRLHGVPGNFRWLFKGLDSFESERIVDEYKELEARSDKTDERFFLEIKDDLLGLTPVEKRRLQYIRDNPGTGLSGFEATRHAILHEQVSRLINAERKSKDKPVDRRMEGWVPSYVSYDDETIKIRRIIKFVRDGSSGIPTDKMDEVRDDGMKILQNAIKRKGLSDHSKTRVAWLAKNYKSPPATVTRDEVDDEIRDLLREYFSSPDQAGPGAIVTPPLYGAGPPVGPGGVVEDHHIPTTPYSFITSWDLTDAKSRHISEFHMDNYLLRMQTAVIPRWLPKASKMWWTRKKIKAKFESLFDDLNEEIHFEKVFKAKWAGHRLVLEQIDAEFVEYERFTEAEQAQIQKLFEAEIKKISAAEKEQEAY